MRFDIENEAAYYVNIDYFYGLFFERCEIYRVFIMQKILLFNLMYDEVRSSLSLIHDLRTYKSHTLDKDKSHDKNVIERIEKWHYKLTGRRRLCSADYLICSNELIDLVKKILEAMLCCIKKIEEDSRKDLIIREMLMEKESYCPDFFIEKQFNEVMLSLGLKADAHILTKKWGKNIRDRMKLFGPTSAEVRDEKMKLLLEEILFSKDVDICSLSGERIMSEFGMTPGRELGDMKRKAIELSKDDPYLTEENLLELLREWKKNRK